MLGFLTMAVLGALHQFAPVVGRKPLRSVGAARLTLAGLIATVMILPGGFAHGPESLVAIGGLIGVVTVLVAVWNLSGPLSGPLRGGQGGVPIQGIRISVAYLVVTVSFGIVYALDRRYGWFILWPNRVLAHATFGVLGWLGITYAAVAEKLWPMFLLSHRRSARAGSWAVGLLAVGVPALAVGILMSWQPMGWAGAALVLAGLSAHLTSLVGSVRNRRRPFELLHAYLAASVVLLAAGAGLALAAALGRYGPGDRAMAVAAAVAALIGWLGLAIIGHAHKIVPFIAYQALRAQGVANGPTGRPLLFADLFNVTAGWAALVASSLGFAGLTVGLATATAPVIVFGGVSLVVAGVVALVNLGLGPRRARYGALPERHTQRNEESNT
jgi:hypothetical protein